MKKIFRNIGLLIILISVLLLVVVTHMDIQSGVETNALIATSGGGIVLGFILYLVIQKLQ